MYQAIPHPARSISERVKQSIREEHSTKLIELDVLTHASSSVLQHKVRVRRCGNEASIIGEQERANLVVSTGQFFYIIYMFVTGTVHTVMLYVLLILRVH